MSIRHTARERAAQFLFQMDFNPDQPAEALELFWGQQEEEKPSNKVISFAEQIVYGVLRNKDEIDRRIISCADNWELSRMGAVDRNVLRVAAYEMLYCNDIPPVVSINEAIDLVKDLSNPESGRFVNGVLDKLLRSITAEQKGKPATDPETEKRAP
ncbi:MAG: transcription antitermination factor NusB [Kiritimatiellae bacterium]|nr:transcription antitermination factor NusB [Kiritimatiellia bacterium]MDD4734989.1 transcription antitermination factor NusB [Kiritimatiellia bacterium]